VVQEEAVAVQIVLLVTVLSVTETFRSALRLAEKEAEEDVEDHAEVEVGAVQVLVQVEVVAKLWLSRTNASLVGINELTFLILLNLGIFLVKGKEDALATKNIVPGESVYGEKRISVPVEGGDAGATIEYRVWNPFRSKLGAAVVAGTENIHISPGAKVLYLGAASGTTVSHVNREHF
jgi:hypothetical protein